jgi:uncharacterized protein (DUF1501 family)
MAITRRQFIKRSGALAASSLLGPSLFNNLFVRQAMAAIEDRFLVIIFLDGGNDGLNTVTPVTNGATGTLRTAYEAARKAGGGGLRLTPAVLGPTLLPDLDPSGSELALHPGLIGLKNLYDLNKVAVIQGCGYPNYTLSHEDSRVIWQSANPLKLGSLTGTGWAGRHLAQQYNSTAIPGVTLGDSVAPEYRQTATSVLAVRRLREFGFPYDYDYPGDVSRKRDAFEALCALAGTGSGVQANQIYVGDTGFATLTSSESYGGEQEGSLHDNYEDDRGTWSEQYGDLNTSTARSLREIAKIIYGVKSGVPNVNARFFQLANGGYDTHSDQGAGETNGSHYVLHREVGDAIELFYNDLANMGVADKTLIMIWSEFSRRIEQNGNGTDHGSQGPMFVIGGGVNGGIYGNHPNINESALDDDGNTVYTQNANPFRSTDFRDVYGTILKQWIKVPQATILSSILPLDTGSATSRWTVANFNMGFLPVVLP